MLIWINGPFGGGKTQTAYALARRLPGSVVADPELVGFGLQRMMPRSLRVDFQDLASWRHGVVEVLDRTLTTYDGHVIVPMTLVEPAYFDEIVGRLRNDAHAVHHVALLADRQTVLRRLRERAVGRLLQRIAAPGWTPRRETFAVANLDRCLERLREPRFAEQLWTDELSLPQVVERVAAGAGLQLEPDRDGPVRRRLRQTWTSARHIRFG